MEKTTRRLSEKPSSDLLAEFFLGYLRQNTTLKTTALYPPTQFQLQQNQKRRYSDYTWRGLRLTVQKLRCLVCLSKGLSRDETTKVLGIAYSTLAEHLTALRCRLGFPNIKAMIDALKASELGCLLSSINIDEKFD